MRPLFDTGFLIAKYWYFYLRLYYIRKEQDSFRTEMYKGKSIEHLTFDFQFFCFKKLTRRGLGVRVLDLAQIDRGCFFYYKKRLRKAFLTNGPSAKCYSYVKLEILATFNY